MMQQTKTKNKKENIYMLYTETEYYKVILTVQLTKNMATITNIYDVEKKTFEELSYSETKEKRMEKSNDIAAQMIAFMKEHDAMILHFDDRRKIEKIFGENLLSLDFKLTPSVTFSASNYYTLQEEWREAILHPLHTLSSTLLKSIHQMNSCFISKWFTGYSFDENGEYVLELPFTHFENKENNTIIFTPTTIYFNEEAFTIETSVEQTVAYIIEKINKKAQLPLLFQNKKELLTRCLDHMFMSRIMWFNQLEDDLIDALDIVKVCQHANQFQSYLALNDYKNELTIGSYTFLFMPLDTKTIVLTKKDLTDDEEMQEVFFIEELGYKQIIHRLVDLAYKDDY